MEEAGTLTAHKFTCAAITVPVQTGQNPPFCRFEHLPLRNQVQLCTYPLQ